VLKLVYLAKRKPEFSFDDFVRRWRRHGALGMQQPLWRHALGYVQAEPIRPAPLAGASEEFDAIACFMVRDEMFAAFTEEDGAGAAVMAADELQTFSAPIPTTSLWVDEERLQGDELGGIAAYLFFEEPAAARATAQRARSAGGLRRIVLDLRRDDGPLGPGANTLPYGAILELSAASVPDLAASVGSEEKGLLDESDLAVVTREAVLWDRLPR